MLSGDAMIQLESLYDDIINGNVTKEDFLLKFKNLEAFSKEDRLKLQIIDASPFTMWACNIDNKIRLWDKYTGMQRKNIYIGLLEVPIF